MQPVQPSYNSNALATLLSRYSGWIYSIAGFSLVNAIMDFAGAQWIFFIALGSTTLVGAITSTAGTTGRAVGLVINLIVAGIFAGLAFFASKGKTWAFITVIVFYVLDAGIFVIMIPGLGSTAYICMAFHVYVLFRIFPGIAASKQFNSLQSTAPPPGGYNPTGSNPPGAWPPPPGPAQGGWNQQPPPQQGWPQQPSNWTQQPPPDQQNWPQQPPTDQQAWPQSPPADPE